MPKKKIPKNVFVVQGDKKKAYVRLDCTGISFWVVLVDGITLSYFTQMPEVPYLPVEAAIAWHEKELCETDGRSGNEEILKLLRIANGDFERRKEQILADMQAGKPWEFRF